MLVGFLLGRSLSGGKGKGRRRYGKVMESMGEKGRLNDNGMEDRCNEAEVKRLCQRAARANG